MAKLVIAGCRGNIGQAMKAWMAKNHPEVQVACLMPFPFKISALQLILSDADYFVNCSALGNNTQSIDYPYEYYQVNTFGVLNQLEAIRLFAPNCRYVNLGTIYEDLSANTPYVSSKKIAREIISTYFTNYDIFAAQVKLGFTEYYNRDKSYLSKKVTLGIAKIYKAISEGKSFEKLELKNLDQPFQWTWAEDVAEGIWMILMQKYSYDEGSELIDQQVHTLRDFVKESIFAAKINLPFSELIDEKNNGMIDYHYHNSDAKRQIGWVPKTSFRELVSLMTKHDILNY